MSTTTATITGNLSRDPELRYTAGGKAVASLGIAVGSRHKNAQGVWEDGETSFYDVTCWDTLAENVCESLTKGSRVIVVAGKAPELREYDKRDGTKGSSLEVTADEVGPSLKWASARVVKGERRPQSDPWATSAPADVPF